MGPYRWLTVDPHEDTHGTELLLGSDQHPVARPFKQALVADGIPAPSLGVVNCQAEHDRFCKLGVNFTQPATDPGPVVTAVLDDTCGNLIQIAERK